MRTTSFRQAEAEALATMTPDERARFDDAAEAGPQQSVAPAVENGGQVPSVSTLWRIARALDLRLTIDMVAAS